MARGPRWTVAEDDVLMQHRDRGPSWEGYAQLLPSRSYNAIMARRKELGIAKARPGRLGGAQPKPWTPDEDRIILENLLRGPNWTGYATLLPDRSVSAIKKRRERLAREELPRAQRAAEANPAKWTPEDDEALVRLALRMTRQCGHPIGECAVRLAELLRARASAC